MKLTKLTTAPNNYQILRAVEYAGYEIAFCIDLASHELYLSKAKRLRGDVTTTWYSIHMMGD